MKLVLLLIRPVAAWQEDWGRKNKIKKINPGLAYKDYKFGL